MSVPKSQPKPDRMPGTQLFMTPGKSKSLALYSSAAEGPQTECQASHLDMYQAWIECLSPRN